MNSFRSRRVLMAAAVSLFVITPLAACSGGSPEAGGGSGASGAKDPAAFTVMSANENAVLSDQLDALAAGACKAENEALPLEHQKVAQADVVQKVTLLAGQGALSAHSIAGTALVRPDGDLGASGLVLDLEAALTESGAWENVLPAAASTETNVYGGVVSMPYQYNIEGIWYNKAIFAENGIDEPQTWDELVDASATLAKSGVVPMSQAGAAGWPLTRILGMYINRNVGPQAMADIQSGKAKLTDPEYLAGAEALAEYAAAGNFGEGFTTRDNDAASNLFLTGGAAMTYDGSWLLSAVNDPDRNQIGAENVGFMPFPAVDGGKGSIDQYPANAGAPMIINAKEAGPKVIDWISCIAENYGAQALGDAGVISGFSVNDEVTGLTPNTAEMQERIAGIDETVLWFEALMDPKSNSLASTNGALLTTGQMTPEDYMADLQASLDANK